MNINLPKNYKSEEKDNRFELTISFEKVEDLSETLFLPFPQLNKLKEKIGNQSVKLIIITNKEYEPVSMMECFSNEKKVLLDQQYLKKEQHKKIIKKQIKKDLGLEKAIEKTNFDYEQKYKEAINFPFEKELYGLKRKEVLLSLSTFYLVSKRESDGAVLAWYRRNNNLFSTYIALDSEREYTVVHYIGRERIEKTGRTLEEAYKTLKNLIKKERLVHLFD